MWLCWQVRYEARSPLHIGMQALGMIRRTRTYVPGRALWGAVTNRLMERLKPRHPDAPADDCWQAVSDFVREHFTFGYLFVEWDGQPLYPVWREDGEMVYGERQMTRREFERRFMTAWESTAIDPWTWAAQDETLHGTEFLSARVQEKDGGSKKRTTFMGYCFAREEALLQLPGSDATYTIQADGLASSDNGEMILWKDVLNTLHVGGELTYGAGRLSLRNMERQQANATLYGLVRLADLSGASPVVERAGDVLPVHAEMEGAGDVSGDLEAFTGRVHSVERGSGQHVSPATLCYTPGACLRNGAPRRWQVGELGIWRKYDAA